MREDSEFAYGYRMGYRDALEDLAIELRDEDRLVLEAFKRAWDEIVGSMKDAPDLQALWG